MKILIDRKGDEFAFDSSLSSSIWNDIIHTDDGRVVVFNTLHRTAVLLTAEEYGNMTEGNSRSTLFRLGILTGNDTDERQLWNDMYRKARHDMSYLDITIVATEKCQFGCIYCFEGTNKSGRVVDDNTADAIMAYADKHLQHLKRMRITWFGGEPLLAYDKIKSLSNKLIDYCAKHSIHYSADITTNGFALTPDRVREMVDDFKIGTYIITLDGTAAIHDARRPLLSGKGTFDRIWRNIRELVKHNAFVLIRSTIDSRNAKDIPGLIDMIAEEKWAGKVWLSFCRTIDISLTPDGTEKYIYSEKEFADIEWELMKYAHSKGVMEYSFPHAAPRGGCLRDGDIVIGTEGEIYKCLDTIGDRRWITGNITQTETKDTPEWLERWNRWMPDDMPGCRNCVLQPLCNGGCPHNALFDDKKHGTALQCPDWKANYRRQIIALIDEHYKTI